MNEFMTLDRNLKLRTLTVFLTVLLGSSIGPNMTIYYVQYFGALVTGFLLIAVSVVSFIAGLYGGHLADVFGRKWTMMLGSVFMILGYATAVVVNSPWLVNPYVTFVGFLLASVGGSLADPAEQAMMIDSSTLENRRFVYSLIYWVINIAVMVGAAIGGWFFREYLFELLLGMMIVAMINMSIIRFGMSETLVKTSGTVSSSVWQAVKSYALVFSDKRYIIFLFGGVMTTVIFTQPDYYLAAHLGESFNQVNLFGVAIYGQRMLSLMLVINTVMIVLMMTLFNKLTENWPLLTAFAIGVALQGFGFAISFLLNDFWPLVLMAVVFTLGEMINVPASQTMRADMMNPAQIGAYSGAFSAARPVGTIIAGGMVTLSHFVGHVGVSIFLMGITVLAIVLTVVARRMPPSFEVQD
jgi:DHA1 family multidrug resistance protein B-like MFS transporter